MNQYNQNIANRILDSQRRFIEDYPQPTMMGGVRAREYALPVSTDFDYPSTLAVGRVSGKYPLTLDGSFWGEALSGGMSERAFNKSLSKVGKKAIPVGSRIAEKQGKKALEKFLSGSGYEYDEDEMEEMEGGEYSSSDEECECEDGEGMCGGKKRYGVSRFVKDLGKISKAVGLKQFLKPIAQASTKKAVEKIEGAGKKKYGVSRFVKDLGKVSKAVGAKQFLKPIAEASTKKAVEKIEGSGRRGRPSKMKTAVMSMEDLGMEGGKKRYGVSRFVKDLGKISKAVGAKQFLKPIAQALTKKAVEKISGAGRRGRPRKGGALLSGEDSGLSGHYPKSQSTAYSGGARKARAEIVKKVMKEKGLSLPMASKYVKEHGLY